MFAIIKGLVAFAVLTLLVLGGILLVGFWFWVIEKSCDSLGAGKRAE